MRQSSPFPTSAARNNTLADDHSSASNRLEPLPKLPSLDFERTESSVAFSTVSFRTTTTACSRKSWRPVESFRSSADLKEESSELFCSNVPTCESNLLLVRAFPPSLTSVSILPFSSRPPFSAAVARELNVAVYDILTLGKMVSPFPHLDLSFS